MFLLSEHAQARLTRKARAVSVKGTAESSGGHCCKTALGRGRQGRALLAQGPLEASVAPCPSPSALPQLSSSSPRELFSSLSGILHFPRHSFIPKSFPCGIQT